MPDPDLTAYLAQFGTAGLVGWMWLTERRAAAERERQLTSAHERLTQERACFEAAVAAITENTRVLGSLESGQRTLLSFLQRWERTPTTLPAPSAPRPGAAVPGPGAGR